MDGLPSDVLWIIMEYVFPIYTSTKVYGRHPHAVTNIRKNITTFGRSSVMSDLFLFRRVSKQFKRVVEKKTTRYKSKIDTLNPYRLVFK